MKALLLLTVFFSGLIAGLFYAYSCSVNPGLKALSNAEYIKAMQAINVAIQNPFFLCVFTGLLLLLPVTTFQLYQQHAPLSLAVAAMLIYFIGVFGITVICNVPLNNKLAKFPVATATASELSAMRQAFEKPWNTWHAIRTISSIASFTLLILFLLKQKG